MEENICVCCDSSETEKLDCGHYACEVHSYGFVVNGEMKSFCNSCEPPK